jgi:type II secretory pathway predicted ATPase ExeA
LNDVAATSRIVAIRPTAPGGIAGRTDTLFAGDAVTVIHNATRGYPRAVNNLAVNALTAALAKNQPIVDEKAARIAVTETGHD